jgi:hypothetical protein
MNDRQIRREKKPATGETAPVAKAIRRQCE